MVDPQHTSSPSLWTTFTNFLRTQKAVLLIAEIIFCIVVLCCFRAAEYYHLSEAELVLGIFFFIIYSGGLQNYIAWIIWPWCDFLRSFAAAILYLIASIPAFSVKGNSSATMEGVMGLFAVCLFGYDTAISFPLRQ
ncbi:Proteolipid protein 2 [Myotis davidii]|uniref:Proteolipid protein 2 n=1 Tax=Myotis davidii TaxID=225400 RepID=L5LYZ5_MYODS|nr:Proteolipid protein 2 [Myotis davidii]